MCDVLVSMHAWCLVIVSWYVTIVTYVHNELVGIPTDTEPRVANVLITATVLLPSSAQAAAAAAADVIHQNDLRHGQG